MNERDPWVAREPGFLQLRIELMRLARRAGRRKLLTLVCALLVAAAAAGMRMRKGEAFVATVTFRIVEGEMSAEKEKQVTPIRDLQDYVSSVALSSTRLIEVMKRHGISASLAEINPVQAVELFRDDIEVEVWRNYFKIYEGPQAERSARLGLAYKSDTAERAFAVATDLAELVTSEEDRRLKGQVQAALLGANQAVELARADIDRRNAEISRIEQEIPLAATERKAVLQVERIGLYRSLRPANERLIAAERERTELTLVLQFETMGWGLRFEKVDERVRQIAFRATPMRLLVIGFAVFLMALPLAMVFVGAFDKKVYDLDDVRRLGLTAVGHVPPFPGDQSGSLRARAR